VASLPAAFSGLKATKTKDGGISFVVNSLAYRNGSAYNAELEPTPLSSARLYAAPYIRHWDTYLSQERYAVFAGSLSSKNGAYTFDGSLKNLLSGIEAPVTRPETPVQPFGDLGDYDLSPDGKTVAFLTKAPELAKANYTASYIYLVPHDGSSVAKAINGPGSEWNKRGAKGASMSPRFSPDGKKLLYGQMDGISYESDRTKIYVADLSSYGGYGNNAPSIKAVAENWDSSPGWLGWGPDSKKLYVGSDLYAAARLFIIPADAGANYQPKNLTSWDSSILDMAIFPNGDALVSANAVWSSRCWYTVTPSTGKIKQLFNANEVDKELAGLKPGDITNFWYKGSRGELQQSVIITPTGFDKSKKYPVVFYVHGGPQGYTGNTWSTRWNLRVWADQGYVLIGPNPVGSTSYGQALCDAIQNQWGGTPYNDLVNAWQYVVDNIPYADTHNAVAAGASYGGYMMNWIQGHDLGRKFKAIVAHDGVASTWSDYGTEELWFIQRENNGTIWNNHDNFGKWVSSRTS
jgi:dipeptidyl aminopeptidase/acylaminoacyl peptidase